MEIELESGHDADRPAPAGRPQQVGVPVGRRRYALAATGDDVDRPEVVGGEPVLRREVARPAAEREPRHPGVGDHAAGRRQPERLRGAVDHPPVRSRTDAGRPALRIDADPRQPRTIDDEAAGDDRRAGDAVAAAPDRHGEVVLPGERDRCDHVADVVTVRDRDRVLVHHPVPDPACLGVRVVSRSNNVASEPVGERGERERRGRRERSPVRVHTGRSRLSGLRLGHPSGGHRMIVTGTVALSTTLLATLPTTCSRFSESPRWPR